MSMVGYVLGLGDRHTENILFDSTNGDLVHVDFSCVFNNGLTLPWPERVPFRLTRNMVYAMGPTGYEGIFRRSSEVVMRLLRRELDPLLAVFRPIYFDALVEQSGNVRPGSSNSSETGGEFVVWMICLSNLLNLLKEHNNYEICFFPYFNLVGRLRRGYEVTTGTNDVDFVDRVTKAATEKLTGMEDRLKGKITEQDGFNQILPMSVEGQVSLEIYLFIHSYLFNYFFCF